MRLHLQKGDRIELLHMEDDPNPIPVGTRGTVVRVSQVGGVFAQVDVDWDNGSKLMLTIPPDRVRVLPSEGN